jgi:dipeptidyl aminopeptidase/acylaminoacyl peptidase
MIEKPMTNDKVMKGAVAVLAVLALAMAAVFHVQNFRRMEGQSATSVQPTQVTGEQPAPATNTALPPENTPPVAGSLALTGREPFGPTVSPDRKWLLRHSVTMEQGLGEPGKTYSRWVHTLTLRSLVGEAPRQILEAYEYRYDSFEPYKNEPATSYWTPAGWSADGTKVYYVSAPETDGLGGAYPTFQTAGADLHEVDIETGKVTLVAEAKWDVVNGIKDVFAVKGMLLVAERKGSAVEAWVANLRGGEKRVVYSVTDRSSSGISAAMIDPTAKRVAVVRYDLVEGGTGLDYRYALMVFDLDGKQLSKEIKLGEDFGSIQSWMGEKVTIKDNHGGVASLDISN